jgi:hypothetical protein
MVEFPIHGSKYFDVRELVDARTWNILGVKAQWMVSPEIVRVCDKLREITGLPVTVNNWHFAKKGDTVYDSSGFRAVWDKTGGLLSQHRRGTAADVKVLGMTPTIVHGIILQNSAVFEALGLTTMESLAFTRSWSHLDCRPRIEGIHPKNGFLIVEP